MRRFALSSSARCKYPIQKLAHGLLERWKLDSFLADSVLYHHEPLARVASAHPLIRIVYLAHLLSSKIHNDPAVIEAGNICNLQTRDLESIANIAENKVNESAKFLGIDLTGADEVPSHTAYIPQSPAQKKLNEELNTIVQASETAKTFAKQANEAELLDCISRSAHILFQLEEVSILLMNASNNMLTGNPADPRQMIAEFSMHATGSGPICEAILRNQAIFFTGREKLLGIAEEQLLRILGAKCLVCLPLLFKDTCYGVIVGGTAASALPELQNNPAFLHTFSAQASSALHALRHRELEVKHQLDIKAEEFRMASRKVAHEVNNPLSIIKNYLTLLNEKQARQEPISGDISVLQSEIDRVGKIIKQFADPQPMPEPGTSDLSKIMRDVIRVFRDTQFAPKSVNIIARTENQPPYVDCSEDAVKQILINLFKNAIEAMPGGGELLVENKGHATRDGRVFVEVMIRDTGPGLPDEIRENLYMPKTGATRASQRGLGLHIVHDLVKKSGGHITCRSSADGTSFEILLPASKRNFQPDVQKS